MWSVNQRGSEFYAWIFLAFVSALLGLVIITARDSLNEKVENQVTEWCSSAGTSYLAYKDTLVLNVDDAGLPVLCGEPEIVPRDFIQE